MSENFKWPQKKPTIKERGKNAIRKAKENTDLIVGGGAAAVLLAIAIDTNRKHLPSSTNTPDSGHSKPTLVVHEPPAPQKTISGVTYDEELAPTVINRGTAGVTGQGSTDGITQFSDPFKNVLEVELTRNAMDYRLRNDTSLNEKERAEKEIEILKKYMKSPSFKAKLIDDYARSSPEARKLFEDAKRYSEEQKQASPQR
jgi:hypothetical protein